MKQLIFYFLLGTLIPISGASQFSCIPSHISDCDNCSNLISNSGFEEFTNPFLQQLFVVPPCDGTTNQGTVCNWNAIAGTPDLFDGELYNFQNPPEGWPICQLVATADGIGCLKFL
jgi:hypothetical protein